MVLAESPSQFIATDLAARQSRHDTTDSPDNEGPELFWRTLADIAEGDALWLRATHAKLVADGEPAKAAVLYIAEWIGGLLGDVVGFTIATTSAGLLLHHDVPLRCQAQGWTDRADVSGCRMVVTADHPWAGLAGVETVATAAAVSEAAVTALVATLTPTLRHCTRLAKVSMNSLWAEVADAIGAATAATPALDSTGETIPVLRSILDTPAAPWRKRPTLWVAKTASQPMVIAQKGGCCLSYTTPVPADPANEEDGPPDTDTDIGELDADPRRAAYSARFPDEQPRYCSTCRFRDPADVEAREVFWSDFHC